MENKEFFKWMLVLIFILILGKINANETIKLNTLVVPTDTGLEYRDTSILIDVISTHIIKINDSVYTGLKRKVTYNLEDYIVYDTYSTNEEYFDISFHINPNTSMLEQVVLYYKGEYYCFR